MFINEMIQLYDLIKKSYNLKDKVEKAAEILSNTVIKGGKIYIIGNGGSASDANHFVGEILGRYRKERKALGAISLVSDIATITAIANDYGFEYIFSRQLEGVFNQEKDILITLSTSGNSENIIEALDYLDEIGGKSINLLGNNGGIIGLKNFENRFN